MLALSGCRRKQDDVSKLSPTGRGPRECSSQYPRLSPTRPPLTPGREARARACVERVALAGGLDRVPGRVRGEGGKDRMDQVVDSWLKEGQGRVVVPGVREVGRGVVGQQRGSRED